LQTTIVEIDPAVYAAARQYFGLSDPTANGGSVHLQDARTFVGNRSALNVEMTQPVLYDIVVHDCFSGGGVPGHIFTTEFWDKLKSIMNPSGVIAVVRILFAGSRGLKILLCVQNFAGAPNSPSARSILATLNKTFGSCRAFHDYTADISPEKLESEFINMVFFCRPSGIAVSFRPPVEADYLNSYLRRHMFADFQSREVPPEVLAKAEYTGLRPQNPDADEWVLTDLHNPLEAWQNDGAMHHWQGEQTFGYSTTTLTRGCSDARCATSIVLEDVLSTGDIYVPFSHYHHEPAVENYPSSANSMCAVYAGYICVLQSWKPGCCNTREVALNN
jgi:hypothetical protein